MATQPNKDNPYFGIPTSETTKEGFTKQSAIDYWKNQAAPTPVTPEVPVTPPTVAPVAPEGTPEAPKVYNKKQITQNIQDTYKQATGGAKANEAFVNAVARLTRGREATQDELGKTEATQFKAVGLSLDDVLKRFDPEGTLLSATPGMGIETPKPDVPGEAPAPGKKLTFEERVAKQTEAGRAAKEADRTALGADEKETKAGESRAVLDQMATDLDFSKIISAEAGARRGDEYDADVLAAEGKPVPMTFINRQINALSKDFNLKESQVARYEAIKNATDAYNYNTQLNQYNMLRGEANLAQQRVVEMANDRKEYRQIVLENMEREGKVETQEKKDLEMKNANSWEKESKGYSSIAPENYEAMVREYGENRIYTDAYGDSYLRPLVEQVAGDFQFITGSENQAGGIFDKNTGVFSLFDTSGSPGGTVATSTGDVYDIGSYATDPNHETAIQGMLNKIGQFNTVEDIDNYIKTVAPTSKITGDMVRNASEKHGVAWEVIVAMMQQDSSLGTKGLGAKNNNPGNIGQFDRLGTEGVKGYATLQDGVNAVAGNLAWRKVGKKDLDQEVSSFVKQVQDGSITTNQALANVSKGKKPALIEALSSVPAPTDTDADLLAKQKMTNAIALKDHAGLNSSVGPVPGTRLPLGDLFGAKADFTAKIDQLISDLSLESLIEAKSRGATFGALSDTEMKILSSAATTMASWRKEDFIGSGTDHYAIDEKRFKEELDNISKIFKRAIKSTITEEETSELDPLGILSINTANSTNPLGI